MRLAIFSDLHGNRFAGEAVLDAIHRYGTFEAIIAAGDLCLGGSDPKRSLDLLIENKVLAVYGNTELYLRFPQQVPPDEAHRKMWPTLEPAVLWTISQLTTEQIIWLEDLPFEWKFSPTGKPEDELVVVHANPKDVELMVLPGEEEQFQIFGEVPQPDDAPELVASFEKVQARAIAFGHYHYSFKRIWREKTLVDVASCSLPRFGPDPRVSFTICEWNGSSWIFTQHKVNYDSHLEKEALLASDMASKEHFLRYYE